MKSKVIYMKKMVRSPKDNEEYILFNPNYTLDEIDRNNKQIIDTDMLYDNLIEDIMNTYNKYRSKSILMNLSTNIEVSISSLSDHKIEIQINISPHVNDTELDACRWVLNFRGVENISDDLDVFMNYISRQLP